MRQLLCLADDEVCSLSHRILARPSLAPLSVGAPVLALPLWRAARTAVTVLAPMAPSALRRETTVAMSKEKP